MSSRWLRNSFIYLLILVAVIAIVVSFFRGGSDTKSKTFGDVIAAGRNGELKSIEVSGQSWNAPSPVSFPAQSVEVAAPKERTEIAFTYPLGELFNNSHNPGIRPDPGQIDQVHSRISPP